MGKVTRFAYNAQGQVTRTWGDAAYPVKYDYDTYGRMEKMRTYRSDAGFDSDIFPESATGDETAWQYDDATGLLNAKVYADGSQVSYTYEAGSRLATRVWARTQGGIPLVTSYGYDPDTGELLLIDYSDETPDITLAYDRLGRQSNITDAFGTRSFAYNQALQLESETMAGLYDTVLTRQYETAGVRGRNTGFVLDSGYSAVYGYDAVGRFKALSWNVGGSAGSTTYAYVPNSDLIGSLATDTGQITTYSYEPNRNLKTTVENAFNAVVISRYDNRYDAIGRRTSVANAGSAFAQNAFNAYNYNDRSELTESARYQGTDPADLTTPVSDEYRAYTYDPIGNRTGSTVAGESGTYTSNELNQYTGQAVPGDNTNSFTYDDDGNLTSVTNLDGTTRYTYNAENRLVTVEPETPADGATKVEFIYDYMGRRVQKTVYAYATDHWSLITDHLFVYDGWNMIEEITDDGSASKYFVWGLDLSQSLQGAGGVGGLLANIDSSLTYRYCYDGNGNVGQMVNAANSEIAFHYEYDPFGNQVIATRTEAEFEHYRFSTKYFDEETSLYYYGYRYYSPELGRWINRDPIGKEGGINVYSIINNRPINRIDFMGLFGGTIHREILKKVYGNEIKYKYLLVLMAGDQSVDIGYAFDSPHHYDDNKFFRANELIDLTHGDLKNLEKSERPMLAKVMLALNENHFAAITHVSADHWSHTNAVELELVSWLPRDLISGSFTLKSHFFPSDNDKAYLEIMEDRLYADDILNDKQLGNNFTHHQLNKDSPETLEGSLNYKGINLHEMAKRRAIESQAEHLEQFKKEAPCIWDVIKK